MSGLTTPKKPTPGTPSGSNTLGYPLSSPYTSNTPLTIPIHPATYKSEECNLTNIEQQLKLPSYKGSEPAISNTKIGCDADHFPFFTTQIQQRLLKSYRGIHKQLINLNQLNDIISDMNESVDAYLFGLFQNAWCVHFHKTPNEEHWHKLHELRKLKREAAKLEDELRLKREQRRHLDLKRMLPPPSSRNSLGFNRSKKINSDSIKRPLSNDRINVNRINKQRRHSPLNGHDNNNNNISINGKKYNRSNRLKLGLAKKIASEQQQIESSFDSTSSDTSVFIRNPIPERPTWEKKKVLKESWKVKHKKPFR